MSGLPQSALAAPIAERLGQYVAAAAKRLDQLDAIVGGGGHEVEFSGRLKLNGTTYELKLRKVAAQ